MAIMKKMLFIINPRSGKEQIRSRLLEILDSFVKAGYGPSVYITQGPKDAEYQAARAKTKELVVCSGGDGTLNEVVSGLMTITPERRSEHLRRYPIRPRRRRKIFWGIRHICWKPSSA